MPEPPDASVPVAESHERRNVFVTSEGACDVTQPGDARRNVNPTRPPAAGPAGKPIEIRAPDPGRHGNRLARTRRRAHPPRIPLARSAAALAIAAVTVAMLAFALANPDQRPPRSGGVARPATVAPAASEPLDAPPLPGVADTTKRRHRPTARARSRPKPTPRPAPRRPAPRRSRTPAQPSMPSPVPPPAPSPSLAPAPSQIPASPAGRRPPTLPAPVPPGAPPEFM
jgi:hypothetical protein